MPIFDVEFEVYCSCGNGLCSTSKTGLNSKGYLYITVEPCEKCIARAQDIGYEKGLTEGE